MHYDNLVTDFDTDNIDVPGQGHVGVTTVAVIVVLYVKTLLLLFSLFV